MKKYFFILLFIATFFGFLTVAKARDVTGEKCDTAGAQTELCLGNIAATLYCSSPEGVAYYCSYGYGTAGYCSFPENASPDQCADKYLDTIKSCVENNKNCLDPCESTYKNCTKSCPCDPELGLMFRCSGEFDTKYITCLDNCSAKQDACRSNCFTSRDSCTKLAHDDYKECAKQRLKWKGKDSSTEDCAAKNRVCVEESDSSGVVRANCKNSTTPTVTGGESLPDLNEYLKCIDEAVAKYGGEGHGYWGGCKYSPGFGIDTDRNCPPEYTAELEECDRKYAIKNPSSVGPTTPNAPDAQQDETPPGTFCKAIPTEQNSADAVEKEDKNLQKALARLNKIKKSGDERAIEHAIEDELALLDKESKERMGFLRGTADDIHEIASNGVGWQEFSETIELIKKGELGSYSKLDLATDLIKSFNDYNDSIAGGATVEDAAADALLNNFGSTALTSIPILKAIDLIAKTPDMVLGIFDVDEESWLRKNITDGIIAKFSPSGVVEQTTALMLENDWSSIGGALSYQWGKVRSADGAWATAKESGKLVAGGIGAGAVSLARVFRDTTASTIFVGRTAVNCVSSLFGY